MSFGEEAQQTVDRPVHSRLSRRIDQKKERSVPEIFLMVKVLAARY